MLSKVPKHRVQRYCKVAFQSDMSYLSEWRFQTFLVCINTRAILHANAGKRSQPDYGLGLLTPVANFSLHSLTSNICTVPWPSGQADPPTHVLHRWLELPLTAWLNLNDNGTVGRCLSHMEQVCSKIHIEERSYLITCIFFVTCSRTP